MQFKHALVAVFICILTTSVLGGCASTSGLRYPGHKTFIDENLSRLEVGMSPDQVRTLLGEPDEQYQGTFGADVGQEWEGLVWVYFVEPDKSLKFAKRYKKSLFVFYPPEGEMKLNHWDLELD